ncbi:MAG: NAD(P)/FAD-dependent oxidoreductase [Pseudomonadota bacterium]
MSADLETAVIGAGVVGLAVAQRLACAGQEVMVLEQHGLIGSETSARNSEVIHAGIYYPKGSLRASACVRGKALLYQFCADHGVTAKRCGKLIVATHEGEADGIGALIARAAANGVDDLTPLSAADAHAMEPALRCVAAALSPSTGVVDSHAFMVALEGMLTSHGGQVVLNTRVEAIERQASGLFALRLSAGAREDGARADRADDEAGNGTQITAKRVVVCAGLQATRLGTTLFGGADGVPDAQRETGHESSPRRTHYTVPTMHPAKGHYYSLGGASPFSRLIYPMPDGAWLGVHLTLDTGGQTKFGPDLAWCADEAFTYDFEPVMADGRARREAFARSIERWYPGLDETALQPGYTGVRPKLYRQGEPAADFQIHGRDEHGVENVVALYGIESPGLTSSLAIAEMVAGKL